MRLRMRSRGWVARGQFAGGSVAVAVVGGPSDCPALANPLRRLAVQGLPEVGSDCQLGIGAGRVVDDAGGRGSGAHRCEQYSIQELSQRSAAYFPPRC